MNPRLYHKRRPRIQEQGANRKHRPDYFLALLAVSLVAIGLIVVYAISPGVSASRGISEGYFIGKQIIAALLGLGAFLAVANLPLKIWKNLEVPLIILSIMVVVAVRLFGEEINGAQRWIQIGGISFQAAELIKLALAVWLAGFLSARVKEGKKGDFHLTFKPLLIAVALIGIVVAGLESDLGSAAVMIAMIVTAVYMIGSPLRNLGLVLLIVVLFLAIATVSSDYRRDRVATFFNPTADCQDEGYQICESLKAIGSGGMFGKGLGKSVQAYGYLPEASNDSIFAIIAEKFGFFGVTILLGLFVALFARIKNVIVRTEDLHTRILLTAVLTWFSLQTVINIGAMVGLLPLKGITLPFISTGGTSLLFVSMALGIVFQASRYTSFSEIPDDDQQGLEMASRPRILRRNI